MLLPSAVVEKFASFRRVGRLFVFRTMQTRGMKLKPLNFEDGCEVGLREVDWP